MRSFGRTIQLSQLPSKVISLIAAAVGIFKVCRSPFKVLKAYASRKPIHVVELRNGLKIRLSSSKHDISTFVVIFCRKEYGRIPKDATIIDIGANIGMFAMYAIMNGARRVIAVEPNMESCRVLEETVRLNRLEDKLTLLHAAIGAESGQVIYIPKKSSPGNVSVKTPTSNPDIFEAIKTIALQDIIDQHQVDEVDILKVDCEGAEYELLPSISDDHLKKVKEIKMEFHGSETPLRDWFRQKGLAITHYWRSKEEKDLGYFWVSK